MQYVLGGRNTKLQQKLKANHNQDPVRQLREFVDKELSYSKN